MDAAGRPLPAPTGRHASTDCTFVQPDRAPWHRDAWRRLKRIGAPEHRHLTIPLATLTVVSTLATVLAPFLGRWPLLLAVLSPRLPFLLVAAHSSPALTFVALATFRSCLADPFNYLLGRRLALDPGRRGVVTRVVGRFGAHGALVAVLVRPIGRHLFAAGALRARPIVVAVADVTGTVAFLCLLRAGVSLL